MKTKQIGKKLLAALLAVATIGTGAVFSVTAATKSAIGADTAKEKALAYAQLSADDVTMYRTELDRDDGVSYYEVEFLHDNTHYDVDVHATDGTILKASKKMYDAWNKEPSTGTITEEKAKEKALSYAGVDAKDATFGKIELDWDDGIRHYEIGFTDSGKLYEIELLASDGTVLEYTWKKLKVKKDGTASTGGTISADKAKAIALGHAGVSSSEATFTKVRLERDDGRLEYDIEFRVGRMEYEFEIEAVTGAILDYEVDYD